MDFSEEAIRKEYEERSFNHPGFNAPLMHRRIRPTDTLLLTKALRKSHQHLRGYIGWAQYAGEWNFHQVQRFVNDHVNAEAPREHFLFTIGEQFVGMGSLAPMPDPFSIQIALWVADGFQGKGIGSRIAATLEWHAFEVFGYHHLYYQHDASNESSKRLPQKLGFRFSHTFDDETHAEKETGYWFSWVKDRPECLSPGLLQGVDIEKFMRPRH